MGTLWGHSNMVFRGAEQGFESLPLRTLNKSFLPYSFSFTALLILTYCTRIYVIWGYTDPPRFL